MPIFSKGVSRGLCNSISYCLGLSFFRLVHRTMGWICAYRRIWSRSYIATFPLTNEPASGALCSAAEWSGAKQSRMERSAALRVSEWVITSPPIRRFECFGPIVHRSVGQYPIFFFSVFSVLWAVFALPCLFNHKQLLLFCIRHPPLPIPYTLMPLPNTHDYAI